MSSKEISELLEALRHDAIDIPSFTCRTCLFVELPAACVVRVEALLRFPSSDEIIIDKFRVSFKHRDLLRLSPGVWLNDEVINFYMKLCEERERELSKIAERRPNLFLNTFFYSKLIDYGRGFKYSNVRKWLKGINIFTYSRVFIPINISQHWSLICVSVSTREIMYLDSMGKDGKDIMTNISKWLLNESNGSYDFLEFTEKNSKCPQQVNGDDCGVFVLSFVDLLSNDLPLDMITQSRCEDIRKSLAFWIVRGSLVSLTVLEVRAIK